MPAPLKAEERLRRQQIGESVRQAREANGWALEDLGLHLHRTSQFRLCRQTLQKIEMGHHRLPPELVKALEVTLRITAGSLTAENGNTRPKARLTGLSIIGHCTAAFRLAVQRHLVSSVQERIRLAAQSRRGMPRFRSPFQFRHGPHTHDEIEQQADLLRHRWGWGEGPVADVTYNLERWSVVITQLAHPDAAVVASGRVSSFPAICWIGNTPANPTESADYRMKILAAFVRSVGFSRDGARSISNEDVARLTRSILIPAVAITDAFGTQRNRITASNLSAFAEIFAVPVGAVVDRAFDLGLTDTEYAATLRQELANNQPGCSHERPRWKDLLPGS